MSNPLCVETIKRQILSAETLEALKEVRSELFGKKGLISSALKDLRSHSGEAHREASLLCNRAKETALKCLREQQISIEQSLLDAKLEKEAIDVTLPPSMTHVGRRHPLVQVMADVIEIFSAMGFSVRRGPDIETEFYNFDALNVDKDHPAREEQDTFYLPQSLVLRTQTSPVQIRTMMTEAPPLRIISPGRVYRADHDRTHTPMFHQVEGFVVEEGIHMGHLKGALDRFLEDFFGSSVQTRLRPSFFPFTEPSAEVDIAYTKHQGRLEVGQGDEWLEVLGCGMIHPRVFQACHLPSSSKGFAFGMGLERLAMLKYGIDDIRLLFLNDQRWLDHYGPPFPEGSL
jgi:phenylalanyl-tRNA synthetase alpha chain